MRDQTKKAKEFSTKEFDFSSEEVNLQGRIRELAVTNALTDAFLILQELRDLKINLSLELQALRDDRKNYHKEIQELFSAIRDELIRIQSRFTVDAMILGLIKPQKTGEEDRDTTIQPGRLGLK